ncbi:serine/threonine-protein kinase [candidate division CSSED10-310 bacterium]|uniref:Serine/threonine-protein kinase n=1 Tax=candidate division CSSED10-310 bacterium TaxID=2855610 RepID=A0ABV6YTZ1_UNCC1
MEEFCDPLELRGEKPVDENVMLLFDARQNRVLYLEPFLYWGRPEQHQDERLLWLQGITADEEGEYRHPLRNFYLTQGFFDPDNPDSAGYNLEEYKKRRLEWPGREELLITPESLKMLQPAKEIPVFEDRYQIVGKLGSGGMGTVWEAEDTVMKRRVAIKQLLKDYTHTPAAHRRFEREGQILALLTHPAVVQVYDAGYSTDDIPYLVMELVEGEDLQRLLGRCESLELQETIPIMLQVLEALEAIHTEKIVHRDVKPSNFILTAEGIRVIDFGIASIQEGTHYTKTAEQMGSEFYRAPEQMSDAQKTTKTADIYGAGCLFYALLKGEPPLPHSSDLKTLLPDIPADIVRIIEKARAGRPEDRFQSAAEMRTMLVEFQQTGLLENPEQLELQTALSSPESPETTAVARPTGVESKQSAIPQPGFPLYIVSKAGKHWKILLPVVMIILITLAALGVYLLPWEKEPLHLKWKGSTHVVRVFNTGSSFPDLFSLLIQKMDHPRFLTFHYRLVGD